MLAEEKMSEEERQHRQHMLEYAQHYSDFQTYSCPVCCEDMSVADHDKIVHCGYCKIKLRVERDAQFEGGMWHDLTKLIPI